MSNAKVAEMLRVLRGEIPRAEVADACDISVSALSMYENGARIPRDETKKKLAAYYGRTVEEIFFAS